MKHLLLLCLFISSATFAQTTNYPGNGKSGFGGAVGQGTLAITDTGDSIFFRLTKGPGQFNDVLVFYIDAIAGGISSTQGLRGSGSAVSTAAAGYNNESQQSVLTFPANFQADLAVGFNKDTGNVFFYAFGVQTTGSATEIVPKGSNTSPNYTQKVSKASLGLSGPVTFKFIGTYISNTAYRSDEGFGESFAGFSRTTQGWQPHTATTFNTYSSLNALPVTISDLRAVKEKNRNVIKWTAAQEVNMEMYEVQRSFNGINFITIASVQPVNSSTTSAAYTAYDNAPRTGVNYYRLLARERGKAEVSRIVSINNFGGNNSIKVFRQGNIVTLALNGIEAGNYKLSIYNSNGQLLQAAILIHDGIDANKVITLKGAPAKGIYRLSIKSADASFSQSFMVD